jgi:serine/threonine-protein kinase
MLAGASTLNGSVDAREIDLTLKASSQAALRGTAKYATIKADEGSSAHLLRLSVDDATITLSEGSRTDIDVKKSLKYDLSSGSRLNYSGDPPVLTGSKASGATIRRQ